MALIPPWGPNAIPAAFEDRQPICLPRRKEIHAGYSFRIYGVADGKLRLLLKRARRAEQGSMAFAHAVNHGQHG